MPIPVINHYMITNCRNAVVARSLQHSKLEDNRPGNTNKNTSCAQQIKWTEIKETRHKIHTKNAFLIDTGVTLVLSVVD